MANLISDFINQESFKKVHFVLMSNSEIHKKTAAMLASQLATPMEQNLNYFLVYYSFTNNQAKSYLNWNQQCLESSCQFANAVRTSTDQDKKERLFEKPTFMDENGFANGADLAITTTLQGMQKLCPTFEINHSEHYFVFLTPTQDVKLEFPYEIVEKHLSLGCKLILLTFNENHFQAALQLASQNKNGQIMAFLVDLKQFDEFSTCMENCSCSDELNVSNPNDNCGKSY